MNFQPKREEDLPKFGPFPKGDYDAEIIQATDEISKTSGNEQIHLVLRVKNDEGRTRTVHDYLVAAVEFKLRHFCVFNGLTDEYENGTLSAKDCAGAVVRVKLRIEAGKGDYEDKNAVVDYLERKVGQRPTPPAGQKPGGEGSFPIAARDKAKKDFLVVWSHFVGEFPAEAPNRDKFWSKAVKSYFEDQDVNRLSPAEWVKFGNAIKTNWDPIDGWKNPQLVGANGSPVSEEEQFKDDDIPF